MKINKIGKVLLILFVALILVLFDLPTETKQKIMPFMPEYITDSKVHLGLDLQGGAHLDYKIDLRKVPASDQEAIVEGVQAVIEKRVNRLGVAEPNIFRSDVADEKHVIVELAGVDVNQAKESIGKTIQLEFKEQVSEPDPNEEAKIKEHAEGTLQKILDSDDFMTTGQEEENFDPVNITYTESEEWKFLDETPTYLEEILDELEIGETYNELIVSEDDYTVTEDGRFVQITGFNIVHLVDSQEAKRTLENNKEVEVSNILIAYTGAEKADAGITRTKEEAKSFATEVNQRLAAGEDFAELAKELSDGPSGVDGGILGEAVKTGGSYDIKFTNAALALENVGDVTDLVETPFGYHLIKANGITEASKETVTEKQVKFSKIFYSTMPDPWQETGLTGEHFVHADVQANQLAQPYVTIQFNGDGGALFSEITERNVGKPLAIFVGGELISAPNVNQKIPSGSAIIEGNFTWDEATTLARDLNTGAIPAPIVLSGQYTVGSSLGADSLNKSLWAGVAGLILLAIYMTLYYRLPGLIAVASLGIYAVILLFLITSELHVLWAVLLSIGMFIFLIIRILNSRDNGWDKLLSGTLAIVALFFFVTLLRNPMVLTLAGVAGVILAIGMAVDANVLIFERIKEEIRQGHTLGSAIETGFSRAWTSIRDSNFSTLITCGILFVFGSSIIKGFAFNLAAGILVSMFTAITITRAFLELLVRSPFAKNYFLLGAKPHQKSRKPFKIIEKTKIWFGFSGVILAVCIAAIFGFGLKLGIDFTGGALMQVNFENEEITREEIGSALQEIGQKINAEIEGGDIEEVAGEPEAIALTKEGATLGDAPTLTTAVETVDLTNTSVIKTSEGFDIKTKYISNETHDKIIEKLEAKFGTLEERGFSIVGPLVGETMKYKATLAIIATLVIIIFYIAFAFRKIPRNVKPWRFGFSAIIALFHDILFVVGIYAILGYFLGVELDIYFITALLTILGYSINDTIVVFDRLRENLKNTNRDVEFKEIANASLTQTMARSINTSLSTLFTLTALLIFGAPSLFYFVLALALGTIVGTYSSIFIASPVLVTWRNYKMKK